MPIYKTGLKEAVETTFVVNLLIKKNFMESVVCRRNQRYTKKNATLLGSNTSITRKMSFQTI